MVKQKKLPETVTGISIIHVCCEPKSGCALRQVWPVNNYQPLRQRLDTFLVMLKICLHYGKMFGQLWVSNDLFEHRNATPFNYIKLEYLLIIHKKIYKKYGTKETTGIFCAWLLQMLHLQRAILPSGCCDVFIWLKGPKKTTNKEKCKSIKSRKS